MKRFAWLLALLTLAAAGPAASMSAASPVKKKTTTSKTKKKATKKPVKKKPAVKKKSTNLLVCRRGCPYSSVQAAANAAPKNGVVRIKPGKYVEGVVLTGHAKDGVTIEGLGTKPEEVVLEGKGAKAADGNPAQNGIFADGADNVTMRNLTAENFPANGFFVRNCTGYTMDHVIAGFNRAYGLYAFNCIGGRMTYSTSYGHGDSGYYVGETPVQSNPVKTLIDHNTAYENVLGYSGTNSKYMDIRNNEFYNNGAGIAPNTLQSEKYPPASDGLISENLSYWNNFDYFKPDSPVKALPAATGGFNYPMGVGVVLFGTTNWTVRDNLIFGNFKWGVMSVSDPTYSAATNHNNKVTYNTFGASFGDDNGTDVWTEGTGTGNCWENNSVGTTYDQGGLPQAVLYPGCSNPQDVEDPVQLAEAAGYLTQTTGQEDSWKKHPHPARPDRTPIDGMTGS